MIPLYSKAGYPPWRTRAKSGLLTGSAGASSSVPSTSQSQPW